MLLDLFKSKKNCEIGGKLEKVKDSSEAKGRNHRASIHLGKKYYSEKKLNLPSPWWCGAWEKVNRKLKNKHLICMLNNYNQWLSKVSFLCKAFGFY